MSALTLIGLTACGSTSGEEKTSQQRTEGALNEIGLCEVQPPFEPNFEPLLEWEWAGSTVRPDHKQVMMTPVVVEVNGDGIPDVVFNSFAGSDYTSNGVMRAISGANGSTLWTVTNTAHEVRGAASIAAGDIDGDGKVELCTVPENGAGIICFENDGTFKFRTTNASSNSWGGPTLADLDGDGTVEIIDGNVVYSNTGAFKWRGSDGFGGPTATGPVSVAADIDQAADGKQEVVNGRSIYLANGTLKCNNGNIGHGLSGVGNFDSDTKGEVVVVWGGFVTLMDDNCATLWTKTIPGGGTGGAPNIADFDNDGKPEVGVAGSDRYVVYDTDGTQLWAKAVQDHSSNRTGSSTFDFEGDGKAEVVYADETRLRIYDGATGTVRFEVAHSSATTYENPVIVDVDGDNNAEIVIASNNYNGTGKAGIRVFRDKKDGWVNTRRIWNQHAYSVTNVNDNGTIPARPVTNWLTPGLNTFRSNSQGSGTTSPFAAPDLVASNVSAACDSGDQGITLTAKVKNQGEAAASADLPVAFYRGNPASGGTLLGVAHVPAVLPAGAETWVTLRLATAPGGLATLYAVADDTGTGTGTEQECIEDNNVASAPVDLSCAPAPQPDLVSSNVSAACDSGGQGITLTAKVTNQGNEATPAGFPVAFFKGNPASGGTLLGVANVPASLAAGSETWVTVRLATAPGGQATLFVAADNTGTGVSTVAESSEDNNTSSASVDLTCAPPAAPDLVASNVSAACDSGGQGITLTGKVKNQGNAATPAGFPVAFYKGNPASGGELLGVTNVPASLAAGAETWVTVQLATAPGGQASLYVVADNTNTVAESNENNNTASASVDLTCAPPAAPDLVSSNVSAACDSGAQSITLTGKVKNQGNAATPAGFPVAFYKGNPASGGTLLGVANVPASLAAGAETWVTVQLATAPGGQASLYVVADNTNTVAESNENNNTASASVNLTCAPPPDDCIEIRLSDYNLFLLEDYKLGLDIQGKVAVGGNTSLADFSAGWALPESNTSNVLVVGGNLSLTRSAIYGDTRYGGTYTGDGSVSFLRGGTLEQGTPIDFVARGAALRQLSTQLDGLAANGTTTLEDWGGITLTGTDAQTNVFDVNASSFNGAVLLSINAPAGSIVVVNIHGTTANFANFGHSLSGGIDANGILYNFVDATTIAANNYGFWGTVLAPLADVTFNNGSWDGGLYAKSLTGGAEGHLAPLPDRDICQ